MNLRTSLSFALSLCVALSARTPAQTPSSTTDPGAGGATETIVFFRHGEKPVKEFGQLNCEGLNRALALPKVLIEKYGRADFIFAPDPEKEKIVRDGIEYSYTRALATIEPTAVQLGLPVGTKFGFTETEQLQTELLAPQYQRSLIFVAWEHIALDQLVKNLVATLGGNSAIVPTWTSKDFDSIYVVRIQTVKDRKTVTFQHDYERLNGLSKDCLDPKRN